MTRGLPSISFGLVRGSRTVATPSMQRLSPLLKAAVPQSRLQKPFRAFTYTRSLASVANHNTMPSSARPNLPPRQLSTTSGDYDLSNNSDLRRQLGTYGLTPPAVETFEIQSQRCLRLLAMKPTPIEKFQYLVHLKATNPHLFYRVLSQNIKELTPLIYTPTVGEACVRWHEIWTQPEGMYLSFSDRGNLRQILDNWPHQVDITVLTDGSRILGLGDLGVNGMGIPVGKLALYTACAGIKPDSTLPLTLDLGTNNKALREDPLYMGSRREKVTAAEEKEFLDELMAALTDKWPNIVIQFEDFKNPFPALERYQNSYAMFNDDVQGTGAVIVGGFINAIKASGVPVRDHRAIFLGAGSAGTGVAMQIVEFFRGGSDRESAPQFWFVDSNGLVTADRSILQKMAKLNDRPIIFPLSNPSSKSECTFEEAVVNTNGRCLFASGSPFPSMEWNERTLTPGQGNNMYVFPGIGLGAILSQAVSITQDMIYASAESLSTSLNKQEVADGWLYPDIRRIREVSVVVTRGVIRAAQKNGVDRATELRQLNDASLDAYIVERMYDPFNESANAADEVSKLINGHTNGVNHITNGVSHL
ncbi:hypothetical protein SNOG_03133 [Parastagonospora nodorum SN15]|uniref:Malic enzyme n=1 Tax=Phaeosphaeria nodorum (strain SN15 / ATCC MYA-4574 / FGSC 10173) TaxID=321614 RepID=Q0UYN1_PHANO|nr:hypothetical protein SNOG_03133 [Parastagonospora nodorum SN15]EAT89864.2 hypothetical protein SNOG_03133 [Parastagonospora nodorum SN15]